MVADEMQYLPSGHGPLQTWLSVGFGLELGFGLGFGFGLGLGLGIGLAAADRARLRA
jgi:hypothetical protein